MKRASLQRQRAVWDTKAARAIVGLCPSHLWQSTWQCEGEHRALWHSHTWGPGNVTHTGASFLLTRAGVWNCSSNQKPEAASSPTQWPSLVLGTLNPELQALCSFQTLLPGFCTELGLCLPSVEQLPGLTCLSGKGEDRVLMLSGIAVLAVLSSPQPSITGPCALISRCHA